MNDPQVIKFVNETVRPIAEQYRALIYRAAAAKERYDSLYGTLTDEANMPAVIEDGREAEGVSRLTCNDVVGLLNHLVNATSAQAVDAGMRSLITKVCVRDLNIQ